VRDSTSGFGLLLHDLDLALHGEGAGEVARDEDVAEAEAAAVVPGRVVAHLDAELPAASRDDRRALRAVDLAA
jgi:hypothetical protein